MTQLKIKSLELKNFKKHQNFSMNFGEERTQISGCNEVGKSTIADAIYFIFTGKNFQDKEFKDIKTRIDGKIQHGIEYGATVIYSIDGTEYVFSRFIKENWTRKTASNDSFLKSHSTVVMINNVEIATLSEFNNKVNELFNIDKFRLISRPQSFIEMEWQEKRKILKELSGIGDGIETASSLGKDAFEFLKPLVESSTYQNERKTLVTQLNKLKKQQSTVESEKNVLFDQIPSGLIETISENEEILNSINRKISSLNEELIDLRSKKFESVDLNAEARKIEQEQFNAITDSISQKKEELNILSSSFRTKMNELYSQLDSEKRNLTMKEGENEFELRKEKESQEEFKLSQQQKENKTSALTSSISSLKIKFDDITEELKGMKEKAQSDIRAVMSDSDKKCSSCGSEITDSNILAANLEKAKLRFKKDFDQKKELRKSIESQLNSLNESMKSLDRKIEIYVPNIQDVTKLIDSVKKIEKQISDHIFDDKGLENEINLLTEQRNNLKSIPPSQIISDAEKTHNEILLLKGVELSILEEKKSVATIEKGRLVELKKTHDTYLSKVSEFESVIKEQIEIEKKIHFISMFTEKYFKSVQDKVNSFFQNVSFEMFTTTLDGNIDDACVLFYKDIPFTEVNAGGKILAGVEISNVLSKFYKLDCPIIVDGKESVTSEIESHNQLIQLIAVEDLPLTITI